MATSNSSGARDRSSLSLRVRVAVRVRFGRLGSGWVTARVQTRVGLCAVNMITPPAGVIVRVRVRVVRVRDL